MRLYDILSLAGLEGKYAVSVLFRFRLKSAGPNIWGIILCYQSWAP
jgi:hypothetical protein